MKQLLLLFSATLAVVMAAHSQTIKMKIASVTPAAGEMISAFQNNNILPVSTGSGGSQTGIPSFTDVKIKKPVGFSSNELFKRSVLGTHTAEVDFEWYDVTNTLFYKIALLDCIVTGYSNLSPECSNCATLSNEISFNFNKIEITDVVANSIIRYNIATRQTY